MKKYLLTSISIHLALLILAAIFSFWCSDKYYSANKVTVYLSNHNSYLENDSRSKTQIVAPSARNDGFFPSLRGVKRPLSLQGQTDNLQNSIKNGTLHAHEIAASPRSTRLLATTKSAKSPTTTFHLTSLLHDLIQKQIKHPSNILSNFGKRKLLLSFTLSPNGHIKNAKILQSSGIAIIDQTALKGLITLPNIKEAQELKKPEEFKVWIEFM